MYETLVRAIVVDDEADSAEVFAEFLRIYDVDVVGIGKNGLEATKLYQQHLPDIAFLDLAMPQYDGLYAVENIRKINQNARIVIITAYDPISVKRQLASLGVTDILQKPYVISDIQNVLYTKIKV